MIRNLMYHIFPCPDAHWHWKWNIDTLSQYINRFNGRLIVGIAVEPKGHKFNSDSADEVIDRFLNTEHLMGRALLKHKKEPEFIVRQNYGHLRECTTFYDMLRIVESKREDEITFFAHAKGMRKSRKRNLYAIRRWISFMLKSNLDNIDYIDKTMREYGCAGVLKGGAGKGSPIQTYNRNIFNKQEWFYDGSFTWFNHKKLFSNPERYNNKLMDYAYGVEWYPCQMFDWEEACDITTSEQRSALFKGSRTFMWVWKEFLKDHKDAISWFNMEGL